MNLMRNNNSIARSLHDVGIAGWFGSIAMGAAAVNRGVSDAGDPKTVGRVTNAVWRRWWPVNLVFILAHLAGGAQLTRANTGRLSKQSGVATATAIKVGLTVASLGAATYSGWLGKKINDAGDVEMIDGTTPTDSTPADISKALKQQAALQWIIPLLTGGVIVMGAVQGEQQRPSNVAAGVVDRLTPDWISERRLPSAPQMPSIPSIPSIHP
jgi:hypothetical protein